MKWEREREREWVEEFNVQLKLVKKICEQQLSIYACIHACTYLYKWKTFKQQSF